VIGRSGSETCARCPLQQLLAVAILISNTWFSISGRVTKFDRSEGVCVGEVWDGMTKVILVSVLCYCRDVKGCTLSEKLVSVFCELLESKLCVCLGGQGTMQRADRDGCWRTGV